MSRLLRHRFQVQRLTGTRFARPADAVAHLTAVQSQDYAGAKWSLGQRVKGATDASIDRAFNEGRFLRTHVLRPTWHFVLPDDIRWLLALTAPHIHRLNSYQERKLELDARILSRTGRIIERALAGGHFLTRDQLAARLEAEGIVASGTRLAYVMMHAELTALVASGPLAGKQQTYALLDERAPFRKVPPRDEMLGMLARRFFASHGPATVRHLAWWSGLSLRDSRAGLAGVAAEFEHERIEGKDWHGFTGREPRAGALEGAFLIPEYDEVLTGWRDLGVADHARTKRGWKDFFLRPIVLDGARAGTWRRSIVKDRVLVEANLFTRLGRDAERKVGRAATRLGEFLRVPAKLARWDGRKD